MLLWLLFISVRYVFDGALYPLEYICVAVAELVESMVLVRLPLIAGRDMEAKAFGVSGGEKGVCNSCSTGGEAGVLGRGFSRLRSLVLLACFFILHDRSEPADAGTESGVADVDCSPV
jgi:hypothetical protein